MDRELGRDGERSTYILIPMDMESSSPDPWSMPGMAISGSSPPWAETAREVVSIHPSVDRSASEEGDMVVRSWASERDSYEPGQSRVLVCRMLIGRKSMVVVVVWVEEKPVPSAVSGWVAEDVSLVVRGRP